MEKADKERLDGGMKLRTVSKEKLEESRQIREAWESKFGFRPTSIWEIGSKANWKHSKNLQRLMGDTVASNTYLTGNISQGVVLRPDEKSCSQFPLELARRIVLMWSEEDDDVFDPFAGMGERMQVTAYLGRNYTGYDISVKFDAQRTELMKKPTIVPFKGVRSCVLGDSRQISYPDNTFDFSFTSPPYWDVEVDAYGNEPEQLGKNKKYGQFLGELDKVIAETIRVVKPGKFIVWVVADIRRDGELIPFHAHVIHLFRTHGAHLHDTIIYEVGTLAAAFIAPLMEQQRMGKTHEYILVFRKRD